MSKKIIGVLKYVSLFIILIVIFNLLLYLACSFDSKKIEKNVKESADILAKQGILYKLTYTFDVTNNNSTDTVIMNESYSVDSNDPFTSYMKARKNYKKGQTDYQLLETTGEGVTIHYNEETKEDEATFYEPTVELKDFLDGKIHHSVNYGRYWHGYLILYRPLLLIFNVLQIRTFTLYIFVLLFAYFLYLLKKRFSTSVMVIYGMSLICSGYFSASYSLESTPIYLVMMISSIIYLKRLDKMKNMGLYIFAFGCIANYVDYLTVPLITLAVPCSLYLLKMIEQEEDWKTCVKFLIKCSILWVTGYALTWFTKWLLYDIFINDGKSMIKIGFTQSFYRTTRVNAEVGTEKSYINAIINIIGKVSFYTIITAGIIMWINKFKINVKEINKSTVVFIIISLYSIIWYVVLANHTLLHGYFTYRQSLLFMLGILLFVNQLFVNSDNKKKRSKKSVK